jgi:hypothetical protein
MKAVFIYVNWKDRIVVGTFSNPWTGRKGLKLIREGYAWCSSITGFDLSGAFTVKFEYDGSISYL